MVQKERKRYEKIVEDSNGHYKLGIRPHSYWEMAIEKKSLSKASKKPLSKKKVIKE